MGKGEQQTPFHCLSEGAHLGLVQGPLHLCQARHRLHNGVEVLEVVLTQLQLGHVDRLPLLREQWHTARAGLPKLCTNHVSPTRQ